MAGNATYHNGLEGMRAQTVRVRMSKLLIGQLIAFFSLYIPAIILRTTHEDLRISNLILGLLIIVGIISGLRIRS